MAGGNCSEGVGDDFFEQILQVPENGSYGRTNMVSGLRGGMPLGLNLEQTGFLRHQQDTTPRFLVDNVNVVDADGISINNNNNHHHHHLRLHDMNHHNNTTSSSPSSTPGITDRDSMQMRGLFSTFGQMHTAPHPQSVRPMLTSPPPPPQPQLQLHHQHQQ